jgi:hypothetical protein
MKIHKRPKKASTVNDPKHLFVYWPKIALPKCCVGRCAAMLQNAYFSVQRFGLLRRMLWHVSKLEGRILGCFGGRNS